MVFQKRLDYGFNGYQVPPVPRAARSARRRGTVSKRTDENKTCAFDLLATVAGNLLLEKVSSPASSNASSEKDQRLNVNQDLDVNCENKELKVEPRDEGSCDRKLFVSEQADNSNLVSKEFPLPQQDDHSGFSSIMTASNCSERLVTKNRDGGEIKNEVGGVCSKIEEGPPVYSKSGGCKLDDEANILVKDELSNEVLVGARSDVCSLENPVVSEDKPPSFFSSDSGAKAPLCGDHNLQSFLPFHRDNVKIVSRDDDENSSGCTRPIPRTRSKYFKQAPRIGDRRIRKILASKCWRATPKYKDDSDRSLKPNYRNRKDCYKRQRSQVVIPFKKRKLFDHSSAWATDGGINSQGYFNSPEKGIGDSSESCSKLQGGKGTARSVAGQHTSFRRRDSHVKLRIKSFRVPELFIEIPETATVGSLKRTVMEAVTAILSGGLRIGVFLQGQKVRDDNVTLLQSGISHDDQLDSLGFTLEPNPSQNPAPLFTTESPHFLPGDDKPQPLPLVRYISSPAIDNQGVSDLSPEPDVPNSGNSVESNHDSARSPTDMPIEKRTMDSKALVPALEMNAKALAVVPAIRKPKQCPEISQRRIRRPFSVTEVEALVHAVEKLGMGRWRDVKLRAFDDVKHRTYVDLKDKWKTLVHTARIAPQQRRGEPVPQELLDRVLNAHAYWSQQQAKQQLKQQSETCLLI